jgi:rare lipoprotein A
MKFAVFLAFQFCLHIVNAQLSAPAETGTASFYAKRFEGRRCTSGEVFRNDSLTAAHKKLPFGTQVRVTNLKNDSAVIVRINDRLPPKSRRKIDLTRRAARQLNFIKQGVTKIKIEVVKTGD